MPRSPQRPPEGGRFPLCFITREAYEGWYERAWKVRCQEPEPLTHCEDCTIEYQTRMKERGLCENPNAPLGIFA